MKSKTHSHPSLNRHTDPSWAQERGLPSSMRSEHSNSDLVIYPSDHREVRGYQNQSRHRGELRQLFGALPAAMQVTVSRSSVSFDGQNTHIEAEEQRFQDGKWTQDRVEGTWEGDQSRAAIETLSRGRALWSSNRPSTPMTKRRPLPRGK